MRTYRIQGEDCTWGASLNNVGRMTGEDISQWVEYDVLTTEILNTRVPGSSDRKVRMFNRVRDSGIAVDASIYRRYAAPVDVGLPTPFGGPEWLYPDDRKVYPWDINEQSRRVRDTHPTTLSYSVTVTPATSARLRWLSGR